MFISSYPHLVRKDLQWFEKELCPTTSRTSALMDMVESLKYRTSVTSNCSFLAHKERICRISISCNRIML